MYKLCVAAIVVLLFSSCGKDDTAVQPSGPQIYFSGGASTSGNTWYEIYACNQNGSAQRKLTNFSANGSNPTNSTHPVFSYDSSFIYFLSNRDGNGFQVFRMKPDGSSVIKITATTISGLKSNATGLQLFQNDEKIVYEQVEANDDPVSEICISNIDGTNQQKLTTVAVDGNCIHPAVNRFNNTIRYSRIIDEEYKTYEMNFDGTGKHEVVADTWGIPSPDKSKIAYTNTIDLFIRNADGTNPVQLTHAGSFASPPLGTAHIGTYTFTPEGKLLYVMVIQDDKSLSTQIYRINADGSANERITNTTELKVNPITEK